MLPNRKDLIDILDKYYVLIDARELYHGVDSVLVEF